MRSSRIAANASALHGSGLRVLFFVGVSSGSTVMAHHHGTHPRSSDLMPEDRAPFIDSTGRCATFGPCAVQG